MFIQLIFFIGLIRPNEYKPVSHVIFDMDGLLLSTEEMYINVDREVCARYGKNFTKLIKSKIIGMADLPAAQTVIKELQLPICPEDYVKQVHELYVLVEQRADDVIIMPGVEKLVKHMHKNGIPMAVASGGTDKMFKLWSRKFNKLFSYFHHIVIGTSDPDVNQTKPAPDTFLVCAQRFSKKPHPSKCLAFEDSPSGVSAAVRAGMQVVMVPQDYISDDLKQEATLVINSMEDFRPEWFGLPPYPGNIEE